LWSINAEQDYHEEQVGEPDRASAGAPSTQRIRAAE
jgi:hypothetical protein